MRIMDEVRRGAVGGVEVAVKREPSRMASSDAMFWNSILLFVSAEPL